MHRLSLNAIVRKLTIGVHAICHVFGTKFLLLSRHIFSRATNFHYWTIFLQSLACFYRLQFLWKVLGFGSLRKSNRSFWSVAVTKNYKTLIFFHCQNTINQRICPNLVLDSCLSSALQLSFVAKQICSLKINSFSLLNRISPICVFLLCMTFLINNKDSVAAQ